MIKRRVKCTYVSLRLSNGSSLLPRKRLQCLTTALSQPFSIGLRPSTVAHVFWAFLLKAPQSIVWERNDIVRVSRSSTLQNLQGKIIMSRKKISTRRFLSQLWRSCVVKRFIAGYTLSASVALTRRLKKKGKRGGIVHLSIAEWCRGICVC